MEMTTLVFPVLGMMTGLRTMTPIAIVCWFAYLGHLPLEGTWAGWAGKLAAVVLFTLLALGELVADKLPKTPNRTAPGPLAARLVTIADVYDALRSRRVYKPSLAHRATLQVMNDWSPGQFDPVLLQLFVSCESQFERIFREIQD